MTFHPEILGTRQARALRLLGPYTIEQGFYLGGGTAIALHLGHRRSVDFDWFRDDPIADPLRLAQELRAGGSFLIGGTERGTLYGTANGVRVSFFEYRYPLLSPLVTWNDGGCRLAALQDLACMKLSAIAQRGSKKDFVDLYALAREGFRLEAMLGWYQEKFAVREIGHLLYALAYFDDADRERMPMMMSRVSWREIKRFLQDWIRESGQKGPWSVGR